jgi:uncharacterized protein YukE
MAGVTPLAAFSSDWVGGDIRGLQGVAETLYAYVPHVQDLAGRLSVVARDLTGDGPDGWQGKAASAFTAAWQKQAMTAVALEEYVTAVAQVIDGLAVELSQVENALEQQAYAVSKHGVRIGAGGNVEGYSGVQGLEWAEAYLKVREQALSEATGARQAAAQQLYSLYQHVMNVNPHPNVGDAVTMGGLLADMLAAPTAARREVLARLKNLKGEDLKLDEEIADAERAGKSVQELQGESSKVAQELDEVQEELGKSGKIENALSKLLDSRVSDVRGFLAGEAGPGKHVAGNTPEDLQAAAEDDPGALDKILKFGDDIPVVDIGTTLLGTAVGTYYDVKGGQSLGSALREEAISNTAGTVAANVAGGMVGVEIGSDLGVAGGPVGIAVGAVVGYGVGDLTHNLLVEPWGQDMHKYGAVLGTLYGIGHSEAATVDDARQLAVGAGHDVEHYWDDIF